MPKRLVVACDGTWSTADQRTVDGRPSPTNVTRVAEAIADKDNNGNAQIPYYGAGVGSIPGERLRGGIFGWGLSREIKRAYQFLVETYEPGDELYFFGYSRGAYMARSTVGFVRNAGILRPRHISRLDEACDLYRNRDDKTRPTAVASQLFRRVAVDAGEPDLLQSLRGRSVGLSAPDGRFEGWPLLVDRQRLEGRVHVAVQFGVVECPALVDE